MSIEKNPRGVFEKKPGSGVWYIRYADETGKIKKKKVGPKHLAIKAVESVRVRRQLAVVAPELVLERPQYKRLDEVMEFAEENSRHKPKTKKLHKTYRRAWNRWWPGVLLKDINAEKIEKWITMRQNTPTYRGKLPSPATVNRDLAYLRSMFNLADKIGWWNGRNPVNKIGKFAEDNLDQRFLSVREAEMILNHLNPVASAIVEIAIQTGLRTNEQFRLRKEDVDIRAGTIRLGDTKSGETQVLEINSRARELLAWFIAMDDTGSEWVFPSGFPRHKGRPMNGRYFSDNVFLPACEELGIKKVRWHTLRHTYGSWLRLAGVPLTSIRDLMRHSTESVTERYAHVGSDTLRAEVEKISAFSSGTKLTPEPGAPMLRLVK